MATARISKLRPWTTKTLRARRAMFNFLRSLGLHPMDFSAAFRATPKNVVHISKIVISGFDQAQAFVVLLTGDDQGRLRKRFRKKKDPQEERKLTPQPRLNVIFEAGIAFGRRPQRTVFVRLGRKMRAFSDMAGIYIPRFTGSREDRERLREQLERAGCSIRARTSWLRAGNFSRPVHTE